MLTIIILRKDGKSGERGEGRNRNERVVERGADHVIIERNKNIYKEKEKNPLDLMGIYASED